MHCILRKINMYSLSSADNFAIKGNDIDTLICHVWDSYELHATSARWDERGVCPGAPGVYYEELCSQYIQSRLTSFRFRAVIH